MQDTQQLRTVIGNGKITLNLTCEKKKRFEKQSLSLPPQEHESFCCGSKTGTFTLFLDVWLPTSSSVK